MKRKTPPKVEFSLADRGAGGGPVVARAERELKQHVLEKGRCITYTETY